MIGPQRYTVRPESDSVCFSGCIYGRMDRFSSHSRLRCIATVDAMSENVYLLNSPDRQGNCDAIQVTTTATAEILARRAEWSTRTSWPNEYLFSVQNSNQHRHEGIWPD